MSLTIIALVTGAICLVTGLALAIQSDSLGAAAGIPGTILIAVAVGAFIVAAGSYNSNEGDSKERGRIDCVEQGNEVLTYNAADYCVKPGSQIIRML